MFLPFSLTLVSFAFCSTASIIVQLPSSNLTSLSLPPWPVIPYIADFGTTRLAIYSYGRSAATLLLPEVRQDLDNLRRTILRQPEPFPDTPVLLTSDIVTLSITLDDAVHAVKPSRKNVGNVIASLSADMAKFGPREITWAVVGVEAHRSGTFNRAAVLRVVFERVEGTQ